MISIETDHSAVYKSVLGDAKPDIHYYTLIVLSCAVATYGLISGSAAVVIGAMLIAPLMGPILGGALAIAAGNRPLLRQAVKAEAMGAVVAIGLSAFLALIVPRSDLTVEIIARTTPTILDLVIALASGAAGTYAICTKPQGAALPGVAIATALMPPLCVVGIGLADQNFAVMSGALLLFLANTIAINVSAIVTFQLAGFSSSDCVLDINDPAACDTSRRRLWYPVALLVLISVPLAYIMYQTYSAASTEKIIRTAMVESIQSIAPQSSLMSSAHRYQDGAHIVEAAFRTTKIITSENIRQMENLLELRLGKPVRLTADIVLVQKVDDKSSVDSFGQLLPKVTEKQIVEVVKAATPEEIIQKTILEKISLLEQTILEDFTFEYRQGSATYTVNAKLSGPPLADGLLAQSIQTVLEDRLKRRVAVRLEYHPPLVPAAAAPSVPAVR
ncbi:TIGR00341 family protein [Anaeroselena agilis]|uniref:TIGR00341 family protein n=1 Tax=Anaeroselena agilis TaxID=3063788 RepID=A0ABU3NZI0_9FIRM|nr:TIGR00341 family protein [Selenomonadales bacterium 4137-cl]